MRQSCVLLHLQVILLERASCLANWKKIIVCPEWTDHSLVTVRERWQCYVYVDPPQMNMNDNIIAFSNNRAPLSHSQPSQGVIVNCCMPNNPCLRLMMRHPSQDRRNWLHISTAVKSMLQFRVALSDSDAIPEKRSDVVVHYAIEGWRKRWTAAPAWFAKEFIDRVATHRLLSSGQNNMASPCCYM